MVYFMLHPTHSLSTITTIRTGAAKHVDSHDGCDVVRVCGSHVPIVSAYSRRWLIVLEVFISHTHIISELPAIS